MINQRAALVAAIALASCFADFVASAPAVSIVECFSIGGLQRAYNDHVHAAVCEKAASALGIKSEWSVRVHDVDGQTHTELEPVEIKIPKQPCEITTVLEVHNADPPSEGDIGDRRPGCCASSIAYANGKYQNGEYRRVPEIENSRIGDKVRLCFVSFLAFCPTGDDRGQMFQATNLRTHESWVKANAAHSCGGA